MGTWLEASVYCEEVFGMSLNTKEGYFVCPECGEPLYEDDWKRHWWETCPICGKPVPFVALNSLRRNKHDCFGALW